MTDSLKVVPDSDTVETGVKNTDAIAQGLADVLADTPSQLKEHILQITLICRNINDAVSGFLNNFDKFTDGLLTWGIENTDRPLSLFLIAAALKFFRNFINFAVQPKPDFFVVDTGEKAFSFFAGDHLSMINDGDLITKLLRFF